jgi:hypothetical protein
MNQPAWGRPVRRITALGEAAGLLVAKIYIIFNGLFLGSWRHARKVA